MTFIDSMITGVAVGMGSGIGGYIATRYAIIHIERFNSHIKGRLNGSNGNGKKDNCDACDGVEHQKEGFHREHP